MHFISSTNLCACPQRLDHINFLLFVLIGRILQEKLDQPVSAPPSPREVSMEIDSPENMMRHICFLKSEVERLKRSLRTTELQRESLSQYARMHSCTAQPLCHHTTARGKQKVLPLINLNSSSLYTYYIQFQIRISTSQLVVHCKQ